METGYKRLGLEYPEPLKNFLRGMETRKRVDNTVWGDHPQKLP